MTINRYDKFALLPTRCSSCNRLFIFEPYNNYEWPLWAPNPATLHKCKRCINDKLR